MKCLIKKIIALTTILIFFTSNYANSFQRDSNQRDSNEYISLSKCIRDIKNSYFINIPQEFMFPEPMLNDSAMMNFKINIDNDTIFFKKELIASTISPHDSYYIAAWNKRDFIYISNHLKSLSNDSILKNRILKYKRDFFRMVETWDTTGLRTKENHLFHSGRQDSYLTRIIIKDGKLCFDTFRFTDLSIPITKENGDIELNTCYNPLYDFYID